MRNQRTYQKSYQKTAENWHFLIDEGNLNW